MAREPITNGRKSDGTFAKGHKGGPGRPKGSKHRLSESLLSALAEDFDQHGVEAIRKTREERPDQYLRICASLVPKDFNVTTDNALEELSTEEIDKMILALCDEIAAQAEAGDEAEAGAKAADKGIH